MDDSWVDRSVYPFAPHFLTVDGGRMHYADEGQGRLVVMVHGTPTWSFLYRHLIADLSRDYRAVAPDHLGFGLSEKPPGWTYHSQDHARNLAALFDHLDLRDVTLAVHDFGGPIGLAWALDHPERVRSLVIFNTFLWSLRGDPAFEWSNRLFNNPLGRWLYLKGNFSAQRIVRAAWGRHRPLAPDVHAQYTRALPDPPARVGTWGFMQSLLGESDWYESLWTRRERIAGMPALILWGMRDIAFKEKELARWTGLFPDARVVRYPEVGHFVPDEAGPEVAAEVRAFLEDS